METWAQLKKELEIVLGSKNVYFQPPPTVQMKYPCIIFELAPGKIKYANDRIYMAKKKYLITVIDKDPGTKIPDRLLQDLRYIRFDRYYTLNNLNHYVYNAYY